MGLAGARPEASYLVIGAGIAGLAAARALQSAGFQVQVLDKGRGVGGRMATRRIEGGVFDHGAQYFTVRDPRFRARVERWQAQGSVRVWAHGFPTAGLDLPIAEAPRYRGNPGMTGVPKALAAGLDIRLATPVQGVGVQDGRWRAWTESGEVFSGDGLILTPPVPQSLQLLARGAIDLPPEIAAQLRGIAYHPCIALLVQSDHPSQVPAPGGMRVREGALRWIADNHKKGISPTEGSITIHAAPDISRQAWDAKDEEIVERLLAEAAPWVQGPIRTCQVHRWRYAQPVEMAPKEEVMITDPLPLIFAGDGFGGGRVEAAALSGLHAADRLIRERQRK